VIDLEQKTEQEISDLAKEYSTIVDKKWIGKIKKTTQCSCIL
jgi:hypothetical protein